MSGDIEGLPHSVQIKVTFDYWWISDGDEAYPLFANLELSDIDTNIKRHVYEGFDEFPSVAYGKQKYQSGTITTILLDNFLQTNKNYRDKVETFINNKKKKYLKNPQGDIWIVDTHTPRRKIFTNVRQDLSSVTFDWMEIEKADISD